MAASEEQENKTVTAEAEAAAARQQAQEGATQSNASSVKNDFSHRQAAGLLAALGRNPPESGYPEARNTLKRQSIATRIAQHFKRNRRGYFIALLALLVGVSVGVILYFAFPFVLPLIAGFIGLTVAPSLLVGLLPGLNLPILTAVLVGAAAMLGTSLLGSLVLRINNALSTRSAAKQASKGPTEIVAQVPSEQDQAAAKQMWKGKIYLTPMETFTDTGRIQLSKHYLSLLQEGIEKGYEKADLLACLQRAKNYDPRATKGLDIGTSTIHTPGITQADQFYISLYKLINEEHSNKTEIITRIELLQGDLPAQEAEKLPPVQVALSTKEAETLPPGWKKYVTREGNEFPDRPFYHSQALKVSVWTIEDARQRQEAHDAKQQADAELVAEPPERQRVSSTSLAPNHSANTKQDPITAVTEYLKKAGEVKAAEGSEHAASSSSTPTAGEHSEDRSQTLQ